MYSARASTVPCPQPSATILRLMCSPMFQYRSISSLLTAATARPRAASIRRSTSSKSDDGALKTFRPGGFGFFGILLMTAPGPGLPDTLPLLTAVSNRMLLCGRGRNRPGGGRFLFFLLGAARSPPESRHQRLRQPQPERQQRPRQPPAPPFLSSAE